MPAVIIVVSPCQISYAFCSSRFWNGKTRNMGTFPWGCWPSSSNTPATIRRPSAESSPPSARALPTWPPRTLAQNSNTVKGFRKQVHRPCRGGTDGPGTGEEATGDLAGSSGGDARETIGGAPPYCFPPEGGTKACSHGLTVRHRCWSREVFVPRLTKPTVRFSLWEKDRMRGDPRSRTRLPPGSLGFLS